MTAIYNTLFLISDWPRRQMGELRDSETELVWYVVPLLVLLALGATVALGALAYCMARGMHLSTTIDVGGGRYLIGCA